jgi:phage FluMu gp28-like protein
MSPTPIADIVKSLESLPPELKEQALQHLISYLEDLPEQAKWDALLERTEEKLVAEACKAKLLAKARSDSRFFVPDDEKITEAMLEIARETRRSLYTKDTVSALSAKASVETVFRLLKYQKEFLLDDSRLILLNWFRASGKGTAATLKIVFDCADKDFRNERTDWVILSRGDREAFGIFQVARKYCEDFLYVFNSSQSQFSSEDGLRRYTQHEIRFPCGSRIISLPANPDTARGYSANFFLNELSIFERDEEIWQSVFPSLRSEHKIIVASTPRGDRSRLFYRLAIDESGAWSKHVVDVHKAVEQGFPMDVEAERSNIDQLDWIQDYELNWLRTSD